MAVLIKGGIKKKRSDEETCFVVESSDASGSPSRLVGLDVVEGVGELSPLGRVRTSQCLAHVVHPDLARVVTSANVEP